MSTAKQTVERNLGEVRRRMAEAAERAGRDPGRIRLVGVTKLVDAHLAQCLFECGCSDLGENRPQELWHKAAQLVGPVQWHLIGHLQRNKVRRTLPLVSLIHSADSVSLLGRLDRVASELGLTAHVLLEVNVSGEASKHGFAPQQMPTALEAVGQLQQVQVHGLMTMAPFDPDPQRARPTFAALRALRQELVTAGRCPPNCRLDELSMGMSGDFEVAIEEGATMVRIGSALFKGLADA